MSHLMYSHLFLPLLSHGIRIIALDRRGFGKSEYTGFTPITITYDTFAADTVSLLKELCDEKHGGLGPFIFVGASMGCGETLLSYNLLQGKARDKCKGFIWLGPSLPYPLQTESNPTAPPRDLWDAILGGLRDDRYGFTRAAMPGIFGHKTVDGVIVKEETLQAFEGIVGMADPVAMERCIDIITTRDFRDDLKELSTQIGKGKGELGLLILHGDSDQGMLRSDVITYMLICPGMPYEASSAIIKDLVPDADVRVYEKAAHGLYLTHKEQVLRDVLSFVKKIGG